MDDATLASQLFSKAGDPVPAVAPDEIKTTWKIYAEMEASHPGELVALVARADPEDCFKSATSTARAVGYEQRFFGCFSMPPESFQSSSRPC